MVNKYSLTFPQKNIWLVEKFFGKSAINTIVGRFEVNKEFDYDICAKAINKMLEVNEGLRLEIKVEGDNVYQYVKEYTEYKVEYYDMSDKSQEELVELEEKLKLIPFEVIDSPLYYISAIKTGEDKGCIFVKLHHLVSDAWTFGNVATSLAEYIDLYSGKEVKQREIPSYTEYIESEKEYVISEKFSKDKEFWKEYLSGITESVGLKENCRESDIDAKRYTVKLDNKLNDSIKEYCKENRLSPYTIFMTALAIYMHRVTEKTDFVIGTPVLGRSNFREKQMMGMFVGTMPVRFKIDEEKTFFDMCKETAKESMSLFRHQKYPYSLMLEDFRKESNIKSNLYEVMISYQNARAEYSDNEKYSSNWLFSEKVQDQFAIHIMDMDETGTLEVHFDYLTSLFEDIEIKYIAKRLFTIIEDGITNNKKIGEIEIMPEEEKNKILYEFNNTKTDYPKDKTVIDLFEEQVRKTPNNIALVFENKEMTYSELNERANALAWYLKNSNICQGAKVGILVDKSLELIVSIVSLLKLGACYVPIEKNYNLERKEFILKNAGCENVLVDEKDDVSVNQINIIELNLNNCDTSFKESYNNPDNPNCVLYTSGTTGEPKGAIIVDRNITKLVKDADYLTFKEDDNLLQAASTSFDVSLFEIWGALLNGATLHIIKKMNLINPNYLKQYLLNNNISILWITSALFNQMIEIDATMFSKLRRIFTGGDVISIKHVNMLKDACPDLMITNCYGPTECVAFTNTYNIYDKMSKRIPLGRPISNTTGYVVDSKNRLLPLYVPGEYIIGGESVGIGYINNEELTKQKFIYNYIDDKFEINRLYKTGDIVQMVDEGKIDFIGRKDNQVKIHGFRIELDEIKVAMQSYGNIKDAVAIIKNEENNKQIYAYYTSEITEENTKLVEYLKTKLPIYMVPSKIMQLDSIPINQNGKIDRKNLPDIKSKVQINSEMTNTQKIIYKILSEKMDIVAGIYDNIFDMGLDSLSVIKLAALLQNEMDSEITTREIYKYNTIYDMAEYLENNIEQRKQKENITLTAAQKSIYMNYLKEPKSTLYNIPFEFEVDTNLIDVSRLKSAIEQIIKTHSNFNMRFKFEKDSIVPDVNDKLEYHIAIEETTSQEYEKIKEEFVKPFNLLQDELFRIRLIKVKKKLHVLCDFYHIIFDGYSLQLFFKELEACYNGENINEEYTYFDYLKDEETLSQDIEYYKSMFSGELSTIDMPYDFAREKNMEYSGHKISRKINKDIFEKIKEYIKQNNFTINSFMQAVYMIVLAKYTYAEDISIGIVDANRINPKYERTMGMFVKTLPFRKQVNWKQETKQFISEVQKQILSNFEHNTCSYEDLIKVLDYTRYNNRTPLFDTIFICQNKLESFLLENHEIMVEELKRENSKFDMSFEVIPSNDRMTLNLEYKTSLFNEETMNRFINNYINVINYIINNPCQYLYDIDMISESEKNIIINEFNNTRSIYPVDKSINTIFEQTVAKYGKKIAIVFEDKQFTYDELNSRANRLARCLLDRNMKKGEVVGILIDKSIEYMVAVLGILKAGLVYMPIVMDTPEERLKYLISNSGAKILITTKEFDRKLDYIDKIYIDYIEELCDYKKIKDDSNLNIEIEGKDKAYIMYTSGTTGTPKGILIPHKGITRLLLNTNLVSYSDKETMLVSGSTTFDTSGFEIWGAMFYGMTLHFMRKKDILTPQYYKRYLKEKRITTTLIPTPIFNQLVEYDAKMFENLNTLYVGGDVLLSNYTNKVKKECPNLKLINIYGPTENSVISASYTVGEKVPDDIPIGRSISNSTCYVVDKCEKLCPIGVPGDLYTGGDGLAFGYINREDLTKEKFTRLETVGEDIYKTGDLTRFEPNGNIIFMGRIDTQIKLRGQRIEILEIQNKILEIPEVKECVVILKGEKESKFLAAYYTENGRINEEQIIEYLKKHLPNYMIPSKFVKIDKMPLNQNGKVDRHALPEVKMLEREKVKPKNDKERLILECYKEVLQNQTFGMTDDFFDNGGDSLMAMALVGRFEEKNISINYADVFKNTTPKDMFNNIYNKKVERIDYSIEKYDYSRINNLLNSNIKLNKIRVKNVLLTGATGFLGIHIMYELFNNKNIDKIYCVVRNKNNQLTKNRLKKRFEYYFKNVRFEKLLEKVVVVEGNIAQLDCIDNEMYETLKNDVDLVINAAAYVKHYGKTEIFEKVNIDAVNNLIEFCIQNNKKLVHISTISVSGNIIESGRTIKSNVKMGTIFDEKKLYIGQKLENVYVKSKFIAERNILEAVIDKKLNANIIRVGNLMGRSSDGVFQENLEDNAFINRIKTLSRLEIIPENMKGLQLEFTPVDLTASAIVNLMDKNDSIIYHVYNKNHIDIEEVRKALLNYGYNIQFVDKNVASENIRNIMKQNDKELLSGIIQDLDSNRELDYSSNTKVSCDMTVDILEKYGFEWKIIDKKYINTFFDYIHGKRFL